MPIQDSEIYEFVNNQIIYFHQTRIQKLQKVKLHNILKRKNPYLYRAKNIITGGELVKTILDAYLSSQEETLFGEFLEKLAIFINQKVYGGIKSASVGIDLDFTKQNIRYLVSIKSGPNWGNSGQIEKMRNNFLKAKKILRTTGGTTHVEAVNGCCYGKDSNPDKGGYLKYCGQDFWEFISGDSDLYLRIIQPISNQAKQHNENFEEQYARVINQFTEEFLDDYVDEGIIDWDKLTQMNSGKASID